MTMTVKHLKDLLDSMDDNVIVVIAKDAEGNDYSPLRNVDIRAYNPETEWNGECYSYANKDVPLGAEECVCLWPAG